MSDRRTEMRRAYETGRLRGALPWALWVVPLALGSLVISGSVNAGFVAIAAILPALIVWARWRGLAAGRAVGPGLLAGTAAFGLALVGCFVCGPLGCATEPGALATACGIAGLAAGAVVGWRSATLASGQARFIVIGATIAGLVGCLGCAYIGVTAMLGMVAGIGLWTAPLLVARSARA